MKDSKIRKIGINSLLILSMFNLFLWQENLPFINYPIASIWASLLQWSHTITLFGMTFFLMLLGSQIKKFDFQSNWFLVVLVNVVGLLWNIFSKDFESTDILRALFPISMDTNSMVSAILLFGLTIPFAKNFPKYVRHKIGLFFLLLFGLSTIWGQSLIGTNSLLRYYILLMLGSFMDDFSFGKQWDRNLLIGSFVGQFVCSTFMTQISLNVHNSPLTSNRFNSVYDIFIILSAIILINYLPKVQIRNYIIPLVLVDSDFLNRRYIKLFNPSVYSDFRHQILYAILLVFGLFLLGKLLSRLLTVQLAIEKDSFYALFNRIQNIDWKYWIYLFALSSVSFLIPIYGNFKNTGIPSASWTKPLYLVFFRDWWMLLLTIFLIHCAIKFIQALINKISITIPLVSVIILGLAIGNNVKLQIRDVPILPSDISEINSDLIQMVPTYVWFLIGGSIVLMIAIAFFIKDRPFKSWKWRIAWLIIPITVYGSAFTWNTYPVQVVMSGFNNNPKFSNQGVGIRINGPLVQFLDNLDISAMEKPSGYSKATMDQIYKEYYQQAQQINKTRKNDISSQTVIFNLSESFANPQRVVDLKNNPIPFISSLKKKTTSGVMMSSGYGGGTANMEYMAMTGMNLSLFSNTLTTPYSQLVTNIKKDWSINQIWKYSGAIHPYSGEFYNRPAVYKKFGLNFFAFKGSKYSIVDQSKLGNNLYDSDQTAYNNVFHYLKTPMFINLITMQNHMPYEPSYYNDTSEWEFDSLPSSVNESELRTFTSGINYTDSAVKKFIEQIDDIDKPITLVFYGDHLPGIYGSKLNSHLLHETDYFIYSNKKAREMGAHNIKQNGNYVAPTSFIPMVFDQTDSKVSPYIAFLTTIFNKMPAMSNDSSLDTVGNATDNTNTIFTDQNGNKVQLDDKQKKLYHEYQLIQYDMTVGKGYLYQHKWTNILK